MRLALATAVALLLTGCGGSSTPSFTSSNSGFVRFVNGSADAGAVDVYVDGTLTASDTNIAYGKLTAYQSFTTGQHTVKVVATGTQTIIGSLSASTMSINGASYVSAVLTGENHPTAASNPLNLVLIVDTPYQTGSGQAVVNFHNAATSVGTSTQFGYYQIASPTTSATLGTSVAIGAETQPEGIPSGVAGSIAIGLYAGTPTNVTITPSQVSTSCGTNVMPCDSGNLSLYLIDGPAASSAPVAGPYPQGIIASQTAAFIGIFDANGT